MKTKTLFLLTFALIVPLTATAQSATQSTPPQPAKRATIEDDPQFKRLSPEQQDMVRKAMGNIDNAVAQERKNAPAPAGAKPPLQSGCEATPAKKPRFHMPKAFQDAIDRQAKQVSGKTGVDLDPKAPDQVLKDAQGKPCPSAALATPKPAAK